MKNLLITIAKLAFIALIFWTGYKMSEATSNGMTIEVFQGVTY